MTLTLLFISLLFFTVLCLYTLIKLVKKKIFLFAFIPLTIFLVGSTIYTYSQLLGYPTTQQLPDNFLVVRSMVAQRRDYIALRLERKRRRNQQHGEIASGKFDYLALFK